MASETGQDSFLRSLVESLDKDGIFVSDRDLPSSRSQAIVIAQASIILDVLVHDALGQALDQCLVTTKKMYRVRLEKLRAEVAALPYVSADLSQATPALVTLSKALTRCGDEAAGIRGAEALTVALTRSIWAARTLTAMTARTVAASTDPGAHAPLARAFEAVAHVLDKHQIKGTTGKEAVAAVVQRGIDTCSAVSRRESTAESPVLVTFSRDLGLHYPLDNTGASSAVEDDRARLLVSFAVCRLAPMLWRFMYRSGGYPGMFTGAPPIRPADEAKIESMSELLLWGNRLSMFVPMAKGRASEGALQEQVAQAWKLIERAYQTYFNEIALFDVPKSAIPRVVARDVALAVKHAMQAGVDADEVMDAARETIAYGMVLH